nr:hypothetical protein GCM10020093_038490 [Planobispora longispora]
METAEGGARFEESRITRAVRYAVEALAFTATLVIVYLVWG